MQVGLHLCSCHETRVGFLVVGQLYADVGSLVSTVVYMQYLVSFLVCNHFNEVALLLLSSCGHLAVSVLCLFLTVPWVGLQCVIVAFPGHSHLLFTVEKFGNVVY